jgi:hypothetical protein
LFYLCETTACENDKKKSQKGKASATCETQGPFWKKFVCLKIFADVANIFVFYQSFLHLRIFAKESLDNMRKTGANARGRMKKCVFVKKYIIVMKILPKQKESCEIC